MPRKTRKQIAGNVDQQPLTGLDEPLARLKLPDLPAGPASSVEDGAGAKTAKPGRVALRRETAHRGGKTVIVVHNFSAQVADSLIETVARGLREACACGGTVKNRTIEIQSDQPATIRTTLEGFGFQVVGIT